MKKLYNGKWNDIWDKPKYVAIREQILESFKDLVFVEEGHKYFLRGKEITCVSNVTHKYKEEFDSEAQAQRTSEKYFNNPESKYYQKTPKEVLAMWEKKSSDACEHGTERHEFGESCFYFMTEQYDKILPAFKDRLTLEEDGRYSFTAIYPKEEAIVKLYEDLPKSVVPILAETKVYNEILGYSGTFDILFYYDAEIDGLNPNQSGLFVMDWKTNEDLYKCFRKSDGRGHYIEKKLLHPFEELPDMPLSLYKLQLALYQMCLEKIGLKVVARRILWLKPDARYEKIALVEDFTKKLENDLMKAII